MQTAVYYFPNFHVDPRNEAVHGKGWTEWELMKHAGPRFPGHMQPKIPAWGYEDEADPAVMARKIDAAADHGFDAFIFDWYWYEGPFLERALNEGFLGAPNRSRMKFALMWANHDWKNFHPGNRDTANYKITFPWTTRKDTIPYVWDYLIEHYLTQPNYWKINGKPYFSIYAISRFISQMGGVEDAAEVLEDFRARAKAAGLTGLHLNAVGLDMLDRSPQSAARHDQVIKTGFDSCTSYNCVCLSEKWMQEFPRVDFQEMADDYIEVAKKTMRALPFPFYPVVTTGWDPSPRTIQSEVYDPAPSYPWMAVMESSPEKLADATRKTAELLMTRPADERIMFFNAWNEWTEGSYLEPDNFYGMKLLEAVRDALKPYAEC